MNASTQRLVLIATVILMILFVFGNYFINFFDPDSSYSLNTTNQPSLGNPDSMVEVVVFQDPTSLDSKNFNNAIFPKIKTDFIDTNKIKYIVIPIANEASSPIAEALLCTYYQDEKKQNSDLFFKFLDYFYENQPASGSELTKESVLAMAAKADPSINVDKIKKCMDRNVYFTIIKQNSAEATRVTNSATVKPPLFVNGRKVDSNSVEAIAKAINDALTIPPEKTGRRN